MKYGSIKREADMFKINNDVDLFPEFLSIVQSQKLFSLFMPENKFINWEQQYITFGGAPIALPRLTAFYGSHDYYYSGIRNVSNAMPKELVDLKDMIEDKIKHTFNSVLFNYYADGKNHISWHADKEKELGNNPVIASVSLGASRVFQFKPRVSDVPRKASDILSVKLDSGSLLVMNDQTQTNWVHRLLKDERVIEPRINLTFRKVI